MKMRPVILLALALLLTSTTGCIKRQSARCERGKWFACAIVGDRYALGRRVDTNQKRAFDAYMSACNLGSDYSCGFAGYRLYNGIGVKPDQVGAIPLLERGCIDEHANSCALLGAAYLSGTGVLTDERRAARLFELGCSLDHDYSCSMFGAHLYMGTHVERDKPRATKMWTSRCDDDSAEACALLMLLRCVKDGQCTEREYDAARKAYAIEPEEPLIAFLHGFSLCLQGQTRRSDDLFDAACEENAELCDVSCEGRRPRLPGDAPTLLPDIDVRDL